MIFKEKVLDCVLCEHACPLCILPKQRSLWSDLDTYVSYLRGIKKKRKKSNIALMMQKEQCITEAAWILKVILHSAANRFLNSCWKSSSSIWVIAPYSEILPLDINSTQRFAARLSWLHNRHLGFLPRFLLKKTNTKHHGTKPTLQSHKEYKAKKVILHNRSQICVSLCGRLICSNVKHYLILLWWTDKST